MVLAMVSFEDSAPRTFSIRRMMLAGLKKWVPMTLPGLDVAAAISSTSRVEVLVARMAPGLHARSRAAKTSFFTSISSNTASMTTSTSARPS